MPYYAVARGYNPGIYFSWDECKKEVANFSGAIYKKFASEMDAEDYILNCNNTSANIYESVYNKFDDNDVNYFVYTDGSCYNNGKIDSVSGIGIFFGVDDSRNVSKLVETTNYKHTNNNEHTNKNKHASENKHTNKTKHQNKNKHANKTTHKQ